MRLRKMKMTSIILVLTCLFLSVDVMPVSAAATGTDSNGFSWQSADGTSYSITGYSGASRSITIPSSIDGHTVTSIADNAFKNTSITNVSIPETVTNIGSFAFYYCTSLSSVTIPDSVIEIGESAFAYDTSLTGITLPDNLNSIQNCTFQDCKAITSIAIPSSVKSIGIYAFVECFSIKSITMSTGITSIGEGAFKDCKLLNNVIMPDSVTSIGNNLFYGCLALSNVKLSNALTAISNFMFYNCTSLTTVIIPNGVTIIGNSAFEDCTALVNITIPSHVAVIGYRAFIMCSSLHNVTIPNSVRSIEFNAFAHCYAFTDIIIPDGVTSLGDYAFYYCKSLTSITLPRSVSSIGFLAFDSCDSNFMVKGFSGTYAQSYAAGNSLKFYNLYEDPANIPPQTQPSQAQSSHTEASQTQTQASQTQLSQSQVSSQGQPTQNQIISNADSGKTNGSNPEKSDISVSVTPSVINLNVGSAKQLIATVLHADANTEAITWSSNNENVATVNSAGVVTAKAIGVATITAAIGSKSAICIVNVANNMVTLYENAKKMSITADKSALNGAVNLSVSDVAEEKNGLNPQYKKRYSVVYCFDIRLEDGDGKAVEPNDNVMVNIPISPSMLKNANRFLVIYIENNGIAHEIKPTVDGNNLVFVTNHFSRYAVVISNITDTKTNPANNSGKTTNGTGKNNWLPVVIAVVVLCVAAGMIVFMKKKNSI